MVRIVTTELSGANVLVWNYTTPQNATEHDGSPKHSCCETFSVRYSNVEHVTSTVTPLEIKSWEVLALGWRFFEY